MKFYKDSYLILACLTIGAFLSTCTCSSTGRTSIFRQYYPEAQKIVDKMTLQQKIGQMSQPDLGSLSSNSVTDFELIQQYALGSILVGGNGAPTENGNLQTGDLDYTLATQANWKKLADRLMQEKINVPLADGTIAKIALLLGTDAVHGNQHILESVLFPHNIGLAATHSVDNFFEQGRATAEQALASGWNYIFAPTVAVSHNPQWGRYYETLGEDPLLISEFARAFVEGAQSYNPTTKRIEGALTSTKHYLGDGATFEGYDEGDSQVQNMSSFLRNNIQGYRGAIKANTGTIMCSYSGINNLPNSMNGDLINVKLKIDEGFDGFVISDYDERYKDSSQGLPTSTTKMPLLDATCAIINAGIDMMMMSGNTEGYHSDLKQCITENRISMDTINESVLRILAVKLSMGLVEYTSADSIDSIANKKQEKSSLQKPFIQSVDAGASALKSAQESLVLLKNDDNLIPANIKNIKNIVLIGERTVNEWNNGQVTDSYLVQDTNNMGAQNGGWTVRWQGYEGNEFWPNLGSGQGQFSTILSSLKVRYPNVRVLQPSYSNPRDLNLVQQDRDAFLAYLKTQNLSSENTLIIGVVGESPYAEFMGDVNVKYCQQQDSTYGCLYDSHANTYMPWQQRTTLEVDYDAFSKQVLSQLKSISVITVLMSGRTALIQNLLSLSNSFIQAWLPGTQGGDAIVSSIFNEYQFGGISGKSNRLPVDWTSSMEDLQGYPIYKRDGTIPKIQNPLFKRGFGIIPQSKNNLSDS